MSFFANSSPLFKNSFSTLAASIFLSAEITKWSCLTFTKIFPLKEVTFSITLITLLKLGSPSLKSSDPTNFVGLDNLLESFDYHKIRKSDTPAVSKVLPIPKPDEPLTDFLYASLVGSLIWLMKTCPNISYAVFQCSHFLNIHTEDHDKAAL